MSYSGGILKGKAGEENNFKIDTAVKSNKKTSGISYEADLPDGLTLDKGSIVGQAVAGTYNVTITASAQGYDSVNAEWTLIIE